MRSPPDSCNMSPSNHPTIARNDIEIAQATEILHLHHNEKLADALEMYIRGYLDGMGEGQPEDQATSCTRSAIQYFADRGAWGIGGKNDLHEAQREAAMIKVVNCVHLGLRLQDVFVPDGAEGSDYQEEGEEVEDEDIFYSADEGDSDEAVIVSGSDSNAGEKAETNGVDHASTQRPRSSSRVARPNGIKSS